MEKIMMQTNFGSVTRSKMVRVVVIATAFFVYVLLAIANGVDTYSAHVAATAFTLPDSVALGTSIFISAIFLLVGSLVWFYARDRKVALLLCAFCYVSMMPFELETSSIMDVSGNSWFTLISNISSTSAIFLLALLLLIFPKNFFASSRISSGETKQHTSIRTITFIKKYTFSITALFCFITFYSILTYLFSNMHSPVWIYTAVVLSSGLLLLSSIITLVISFKYSSKRERAQLRFFTSGIILAFVPFLLLTVLPGSIGLPSINAQITTLPVILVPIAFGYSILRYQLLVFDTYIRRTVKGLLGIIFLAILVYIAIIVGYRDSTSHMLSYIAIATVIAILAPLFWWFAQITTERVLFRESLHYRRLINEPIKLVDEMLTLNHAAQLITVAAIQAVETPQVNLFIHSEESGCYHLSPGLAEGQQDEARSTLLQRLLASSRLLTAVPSLPDAIELHSFVEERLHLAHRPLLAHEVTRERGETPVGLERYLTSASPEEHGDLLLAPIRAQGKMIGLLVLGERGDQQSYAGPDFEIVELLLARFAPLLETARLQERSRRYTTMLNDLYQVNTIPADESQTLESVASVYASVAASSLRVGVELWICQDEKAHGQQELRPLLALGEGPHLITAPSFSLSTRPEDWNSIFSNVRDIHEHEPVSSIPSYFLSEAHIPFAWLPLKKKNGASLGILILTYGRPHQFLKDEIRLLEMFADQCSASLENTSITIELRKAYERQKELDLLKDQFIMTASHELRTPLTAVLGYLELLAQYQDMLDKATSADFVAKAHRGCNELMLMVNNIMDANQMQFTIDKTKMENIPLREAVTYITEMLEAIATREQRQVVVTISPDILVKGDTIRLHQVLLNLLGNAFKYSPAGTPIEIYASIEGNMVLTCVRDHGAGIPQEEQALLFQRFVRLERDLNSPERGTGLGLYICKRLIEAMAGEIWIESSGQEGEGSTFNFTLRLAVAAPLENQQDAPSLSLQR